MKLMELKLAKSGWYWFLNRSELTKKITISILIALFIASWFINVPGRNVPLFVYYIIGIVGVFLVLFVSWVIWKLATDIVEKHL